MSVDCETVRALLDYDWRTGEFRWRKRVAPNAAAGAIAGCNHRKGYIAIKINSKFHSAHRLAWLHYHGRWPVGFIDHINGNGLDNRIANLREATPRQNVMNRKRGTNNACGFKGVFIVDGRWRAAIKNHGVQEIIGHFGTPHEAHTAYCKRAAELFGEYFRGE